MIGTAKADEIFGLAGNDDLFGGNGADQLYGGKGKDTLAGGLGNDKLDGGAGDDKHFGGAGNDTFLSNPGSDAFNGGAGLHDLISYASAAKAATPNSDFTDVAGRTIGITGVLIDLTKHVVNEFAAGTVDRITGVEDIIGSKYGDMILGDDAAQHYSRRRK